MAKSLQIEKAEAQPVKLGASARAAGFNPAMFKDRWLWSLPGA
jgi:hypothetical protein